MIKTIVDNPSSIIALVRNCVFIKDGDVWYRDFEREIPLIEFARNLNKAYGDSKASAMSDEAFSDKMYDDLQFKPEEDIDSFIATFYMALVGMAENRERLKIYETTGLPTTARPEVLQECIDTYGADKQIDQTIEEMSELIKALLKHRRKTIQLEGGNVNPTPDTDTDLARADILEETADVIIMLTQIIMIFGGRDFVERTIESKVYRQKKRLRKETDGQNY
nr:MAG TPA: nucleoside triphosphate pyrophosphohydrolase [Bacteriophage sp.]